MRWFDLVDVFVALVALKVQFVQIGVVDYRVVFNPKKSQRIQRGCSNWNYYRNETNETLILHNPPQSTK